uniref:Uncharacterized protein n=1 Tax=Daphnia magna TaxID=35525 RepID=A0A0P5D5C7_9CRUS
MIGIHHMGSFNQHSLTLHFFHLDHFSLTSALLFFVTDCLDSCNSSSSNCARRRRENNNS